MVVNIIYKGRIISSQCLRKSVE